MKLIIAFAGLVVAVSALSDSELWSDYKESYNKVYKSSLEEKFRFVVFKNNLKVINEHNAQENQSYKMGINKFADWTSEEFRGYLTAKPPTLNHSSVFKSDPHFVAPESVDWREKGAVLEVKDQGDCDASWTFAATGALEGQNVIRHNKSIALSEQFLLDCLLPSDVDACRLIYTEVAYSFIASNGIPAESSYPYTGVSGACIAGEIADITVVDSVHVESEEALAEAVATVGPIAVYINSEKLQTYQSGIIDDDSCSHAWDRALLAVGYGVEGGKAYWILKNSLGTGFGEQGYVRLAKDKNSQCGIGLASTYAVIA